MTLGRTSANGSITYTVTSDSTSIQLSPTQALELANQFDAMYSQIEIDANISTQPVPSSFQGIYAFSGDPTPVLTNPSIAGTYFGFAWSQLESNQGTYHFDVIDAKIQPWIAAGKKIILRISASGWKKWMTPALASWTPDYVYKLGVKSFTETDGAKKPAYWDPKFLAAYGIFLQAVAAKYDNNPNIVCLEMGIGDGGETKPDTRSNSKALKAWEAIGYSDQVWWTTIQAIIKLYQNAFIHTPLAMMPDNSFLGKTSGLNEHTLVNFAIAQTPKLWLQNNGIAKGQVPDPVWQKTIILGEQLLQTAQSGDTLEEDLQLIINYGSSYALCFVQDLVDTKNAATLLKYAAMVK